MSSASLGSATRLRMKLRSRILSRSIASEIRSSCSAIIHCFLSASSIYLFSGISEKNILEEFGGGLDPRAIDLGFGSGWLKRRGGGSDLFLCLQFLPMDYLLKTEP